MLAPVLIAAPADTPVSLEEAKLHCRVDGTDEDDLIEGLIAAAVAHLDGYTGILGRALVTQSWSQSLMRFENCNRLAIGPVASVSDITYYDGEGTQQTLATSVYGLFSDERGAFVARKPNQTWPGVFKRRDAVTISYVAGTAAADVPAPIKQAILLLVGHWYANREAVSLDAPVELPLAVDALLRPYRRVAV